MKSKNENNGLIRKTVGPDIYGVFHSFSFSSIKDGTCSVESSGTGVGFPAFRNQLGGVTKSQGVETREVGNHLDQLLIELIQGGLLFLIFHSRGTKRQHVSLQIKVRGT